MCWGGGWRCRNHVERSGQIVPVWADCGGACVAMQREDSLDTELKDLSLSGGTIYYLHSLI